MSAMAGAKTDTGHEYSERTRTDAFQYLGARVRFHLGLPDISGAAHHRHVDRSGAERHDRPGAAGLLAQGASQAAVAVVSADVVWIRVNAVTGTVLLIADATAKLANWDFYVKMAFVFAGMGVLYTMRKRVFGDPELDNAPLNGSVKRLAWLSLVCWFGAITAGRLLAYVGPVSGLSGGTNK
jgi:hypothetical protein